MERKATSSAKVLTPLALTLALGAFFGCPTVSPSTREVCTNGRDDNRDGRVDCADPTCVRDPACTTLTELCGNGIDDDGNGAIDCLDAACASTAACARTELCDNELDDNGDQRVDCADPLCSGRSICGDGRPEAPGFCGDGVDNDNNGRRDCRDPACFELPCSRGCLCLDGGASAEVDCGDGVDNDADRRMDCLDPDCEGLECGAGCLCVRGAVAEDDCVDGQDNDSDSAIDCADSDCATRSCGPGCRCQAGRATEQRCDDGVDNDLDRTVDCTDADCVGRECNGPDGGCHCRQSAKAETDCTDRRDNDGDRWVDCADRQDCSGVAHGCGTGTSEAVACHDGLDNDLDGARDCEDSDCERQSCGAGCTCAGGARTETGCSDGRDNDGDGAADCQDRDCVQGSEVSCSDGSDNDCNGLVDCADPGCGSATACVDLPVGAPCGSSAMCRSTLCRTETASGWPSGACVGADGACSVDGGVSVGCPSGSSCVSDRFGTFCRKACAASGSCRRAYECHREEAAPSATCVPVCATDADCSRLTGTSNYGCNPWSRLCERLDKGLARLGAACSANSECESGMCLRASSNGGYCEGLCRRSEAACALGRNGLPGTCADDALGDATGRCFEACTSSAQCRPTPYRCGAPPWGGGQGNVCYCRLAGEPCDRASDCCSAANFCSFGICFF